MAKHATFLASKLSFMHATSSFFLIQFFFFFFLSRLVQLCDSLFSTWASLFVSCYQAWKYKRIINYQAQQKAKQRWQWYIWREKWKPEVRDQAPNSCRKQDYYKSWEKALGQWRTFNIQERENNEIKDTGGIMECAMHLLPRQHTKSSYLIFKNIRVYLQQVLIHTSCTVYSSKPDFLQ